MTRTEEIKIFKALYDNAKQETEDLFSDIKTNNELCVDRAYSIVRGMLECKHSFREIHTFIRCMRETDNHTYAHSVNVGILCNICGNWLGYSEEELMVLTVAGLLHDIGKIVTPKEILNKPGKLTAQEFDVVKLHVAKGYNLLNNLNIPDEIKMAALMHHEKQDGSGYMYGLNSEAIPKHTKIVAICDIYDAMVSVRVYKNNINPIASLESMESDLSGKISWHYMQIFKNKLMETYIGKPSSCSA